MAFALNVDTSAFFGSPMNYLIDHIGFSDVLYATFPYTAITWASGTKNMPGVTINVYFIPLDGIASFPTLPAVPSEDEDYHTLDGTIELEANCNVIKLYSTYKTGNLKSETEGETDGKYFKLSGEFFHPGRGDGIVRFATSCVNTPGVLFFEEDSGDYYVVGNIYHPVYLSANFDTGKVGEGKKGIVFTAEAYSDLIITKYAGELPLSPTSS